MRRYIDKYFNNRKVRNLYRSSTDNKYIDLEATLTHFLKNGEWNTDVEHFTYELARKIEITKKFETVYSLGWTKIKDSKIASSLVSSLAALFIYISFKKLQDNNAPTEELFRRMNALMKALDISREEWIVEGSPLYQDIENDLKLLSRKLPIEKQESSLNIVNLDQPTFTSKIVPITILYSEGPIARAYLAMFKSMGLKPKKIIHIVSSIDVSTKKPITKLLPLKYRIKYAAYLQEAKMNYWPRKIEKRYPKLQQNIFKEVNEKFNISFDILNMTTKKLNLSEYCENVETIFAYGLNDEKLNVKLSEDKEGTILYTGGGIVSPSLLSISDTKFIHIHPGFLPDIKGADCSLWSSMLFGRASASCFYMSPGIDTGDMIMSRWMPEFSFYKNETFEEKTLYRAIYSFLDPWIRAVVLRELLNSYNEFNTIEAVAQNEKEGYTYYFMHGKLKTIAYQKLFHNEIYKIFKTVGT